MCMCVLQYMRIRSVYVAICSVLLAMFAYIHTYVHNTALLLVVWQLYRLYIMHMHIKCLLCVGVGEGGRTPHADMNM